MALKKAQNNLAKAVAARQAAKLGIKRPCRVCHVELRSKPGKGRPRTVCDKCRKVASRGYQRDYKRRVRAADRALREGVPT